MQSASRRRPCLRRRRRHPCIPERCGPWDRTLSGFHRHRPAFSQTPSSFHACEDATSPRSGQAALAAAKHGLAAAFNPFLKPPGGKPRPLVVFVEFEFGSERPAEQQRALLETLQQYIRSGEITAPRVHHLGLNVRVGWGSKGLDAAIRAIDLAHAVGIRNVAIDGVVRKEADRVVSLPGLLNYLPPAKAAQVLLHAQEKGVWVHPLKQVDPDTVARSIWSALNTARAMGL